MKTILMQIIQSIALGAILPGLLFTAAKTQQPTEPSYRQPTTEEVMATIAPQPEPETEPVPTPEPEDTSPESHMISVLRTSGQVEQMDLEEYICRVVLGEMPASFQMEALKAQAVAARTYALRSVSGSGKHGDQIICTSSQCCQAYCEPESYIRNGGSFRNVEKVFSAVRQTAGEVIYYNDKLIMATYFSSAGDTTEDAKAVWGNAVPYLTAVSSPEGDDVFDGETVTFSLHEFQSRLGLSLNGKPSEWIGAIAYTAGGGVESIVIGDEVYKGTKIRSLFGLRSTDFAVSVTETAVTFTTNGYGHRVGLSQYGAQAMAGEGSDYRDILTHYYTGTNLGQYPLA